MCGISPFTGLATGKTGQKIINSSPIAMGYAAFAGQKATDSIKNGSLAMGIVPAMAMNKLKSNQFSTAG